VGSYTTEKFAFSLHCSGSSIEEVAMAMGWAHIALSKKCVQDMAKKPCARVANTKTETKMDDIKFGRTQCLKTWPTVVVNEDYLS
jgi:hypothetical protein